MKVALQASEDRLSPMARQMAKWVNHVLSPGYRRYAHGQVWSPTVNVYEDQAAYHVIVDLAGVPHETISLEAEGGTLTLSGERMAPRPLEAAGVSCMHLMEIDHGAFHRRVDIPDSVDTNRISATYRQGLLRIVLPKKPSP